ncbi:hypothetical protein ONE63_010662 [Megalurothrips usitatus]|nr:hypothetical protein ONE63_010662 [Megalurothrips usitatus]
MCSVMMEDHYTIYTELPDPRLAAVTTLRSSKADYRPQPYHLHRLHQPHLQVQRVHSPQPPLGLELRVPSALDAYLTAHQSLHFHQLLQQQQHQQAHQQLQLLRQQQQQQQQVEEEAEPEQTHVTCLYPEILALIFGYLDVAGKGRAAQVCTSWRDAAYQKSVWRGVEAKLHLRRATNPALFQSLVWRGIKKVQVLSLKKSLREVVVYVPALTSLNLSGIYNVTDLGLSNAFMNDLPTLTELNLSLCKQLTDGAMGRIAQHLKNLETLRLEGCSNITNTGLLLIAWGLKRLRRLDLRSCWLVSDQGIGHLSGLNRETAPGNLELEYLGLQDCQRLSDDALRHIATGLKKLRSVNLSFCVGICDAGLRHLAKMPQLESINLRACDNITDAGVSYLAEGGARLTQLDVSFCDKITDTALQHISQSLYSLRSLSLSACPVTDEGIKRIARVLADLDTLNIGQCHHITDDGLQAVAEACVHLQYIDLYGCIGISRAAMESLMKMPKLATINLGLGHVAER